MVDDVCMVSVCRERRGTVADESVEIRVDARLEDMLGRLGMSLDDFLRAANALVDDGESVRDAG